MQNKPVYKKYISSFLDKRDSETWHIKAREILHFSAVIPCMIFLINKLFAYKDPLLNIKIDGITFKNPVIVGAGWDKVGVAVEGLHALGFGGVEVGTVTEFPQVGNPKPREFIIANGVAINRMGFNNPGMNAVAQNLKRYHHKDLTLGISVGKNKTIPDKDAPKAHANVIDKLYRYGKYFVINVSSPNTPGLRVLQDKKPLTQIVKAVQKAMDKHGKRKPIYVKIAPDLTYDAIDDVIGVVKATNINGIIAVNTMLNSNVKGKYIVNDKRLPQWDKQGKRKKRRTWADEMGALSGDDKDYRKIATDFIRHIYTRSHKMGINITIIGVGGIKDSQTALERIKAGANLVQVVTAIRGEGPTVAGDINRGIAQYMRQHHIAHLEDLVGVDAK